MLCSNRPEGFGPNSSISGGLPTQCFFDVVLAPLPAWIYFLLLAAAATFAFISRRPTASGGETRPAAKQRRRWAHLAYISFYYFAIFAVLLMESIEIARLAAAHLGIGLLPFVYVGCLAVLALRITKCLRGWHWQAANAVFWLASLVITAVKVAALGRFSTADPDLARVGAAYPVSDQVTDLAVLVALYAVLAGLEVGLLFLRPSGQNSASGRRAVVTNNEEQ